MLFCFFKHTTGTYSLNIVNYLAEMGSPKIAAPHDRGGSGWHISVPGISITTNIFVLSCRQRYRKIQLRIKNKLVHYLATNRFA